VFCLALRHTVGSPQVKTFSAGQVVLGITAGNRKLIMLLDQRRTVLLLDGLLGVLGIGAIT
jgi:hypothetical protein